MNKYDILSNYLILYFLLLISVVFIAYLDKNKEERFKWTLRYVLILLIFMLISGIRDTSIGRDYIGYFKHYTLVSNGRFSRIGHEIGWIKINYFFAKTGMPAKVFFGGIAGIIWFFFLSASYRFKKLLPLMLFFVITKGFYFWTLSGLRQSIAIMIFFYSIRYIIEKKIILYIGFILLASLFHLSILMMLPVYFIGKIKYNQKIVFILYIFSLFIMSNDFLMKKMVVLAIYITKTISYLQVYSNYIINNHMVTIKKSHGTNLGMLLTIMTVLFVLYKSKEVIKRFPNLNVYYSMFSIYIIFNNIFWQNEIIARLLNYFYITFFIVVSATIYSCKNTIEKIVSIGLLIGFLLLYLVTIYRLIMNVKIV